MHHLAHSQLRSVLCYSFKRNLITLRILTISSESPRRYIHSFITISDSQSHSLLFKIELGKVLPLVCIFKRYVYRASSPSK